ncbi:hypothetical protein [Actinophytocola sp.]
MIVMSRRRQGHRRLVVAAIIVLAVVGVNRHRHTQRDAEVRS